mmetsp:Transcript_23785/g.42789  ORF Transcript_23785/g.42789 Transcript_23785/m.42789 type:complete len:236 (-) Transcript_23785:565-1272(-)
MRDVFRPLGIKLARLCKTAKRAHHRCALRVSGAKVCARPQAGLRRHHDIAHMRLVDKRLLGGGQLRQGIGRRQQRADLATLNIAHKIGEDMRGNHSGAGEGQIAQIKCAQVQIHHRSGNGPRTGVPPAPRQHVDHRRERGAPDNVSHHRDAVAPDRTGQGRAQISGGTRQERIGPKIGHGLMFCLRRHADDCGPPPLGQLDQRRTHAAGRACDQDHIIRRHLCPAQHSFCRAIRA